MAKLFLDANDTFTVSDDVEIIGAAGGNEVVKISGSPNVQLDANIERIELSGNVADYTYLVAGTTITVLLNGTAVATLNGLNQTAKVAFADGSADLELTGLGAAALGGTALPTGTAAAVAPGTIDANDPSTVGDSGSVAGQTFTMTSDADVSGVITGSAGTTSTDGDDTFNATSATLTANDVLLGGSGTDTLNVAATAATTAPSSAVGMENVNFNVTSFADIAVDADNIIGTGTTITVNNLQAGGTTGANIDNVEAGATVVAGAGVTGTLDVDADGFVTIDGGSATTLTADFNNVTSQSTVTANSATSATLANVDDVSFSSTSVTAINIEGDTDTDDSVTLSAKNADDSSVVSLETFNGAGQQVEYLTLSGNGGAVTFDLDATGDDPTKYTFTGDQDVTLVATAGQVSGDTATDSTTAGTTTIKLDLAAATADLDSLAVDVIDLAHTNAQATAATVKDGQAVTISAAAGAAVTLDSTENTTGDETLNLTTKVTQTQDVIVTDFETVNLTVDDGAATTGTVALHDLQATAAANGVVNVSGADNLTLTDANATHLNASALTGMLTATLAADLLKVTGGSGNDTINAADVAFVVDGGEGTDVFNIATGDLDLSGDTVAMDNVEIIAINSDGGANDDTLTVDSTFISGKSYVVTGTDNATAHDTLAVAVVTNPTLDLGSLTVDSEDVDVTIDLAATAGVANTITGSNAADTLTNAGAGAITVDGGAGDDVLATGSGNDVITAGEGADTITAGLGTDSIDLTETTAAIDTVVLTTGGAVANTTITGFDVATAANNGDNVDIDLSDLNGLVADLQLAGNGAGPSIVNAAPVVTTVAVGAYDMGTDATSDILAFAGDYASAGDLETALEVGGTSVLTGNGAFDAGDAFLALYDNGTNSYLAYVTTTAGIADDGNFASGDLTVTNIVEFVGVADATTFVSNNFDIVA